jgi:hypothetical protein
MVNTWEVRLLDKTLMWCLGLLQDCICKQFRHSYCLDRRRLRSASPASVTLDLMYRQHSSLLALHILTAHHSCQLAIAGEIWGMCRKDWRTVPFTFKLWLRAETANLNLVKQTVRC